MAPVPGSTSYHAWCCVKALTTLKRCYLAFNTRGKSLYTNFLTIKVKLATDFKKISDVYVIANTRKQEQQQLEDNSYE